MKQRVEDAWPYGAQLKNPVTVKRVPDWLQSGDVIQKRGNRYFAVSLHAPERRWRACLRRIKILLATLSKSKGKE